MTRPRTVLEVPSFFVPEASDLDAETTYEALAAFARCVVPSLDKRVFQIEWRHHGDEWTATVGSSLHGKRTRTRTVRGARREVTTPLSSSARVLAIFPGNPYVVVTDAQPIGPRPSDWANPFMAGIPTSVRRFDPPESPHIDD